MIARKENPADLFNCTDRKFDFMWVVGCRDANRPYGRYGVG